MRKALVRPLALAALSLGAVTTAFAGPAAAHPAPEPHVHLDASGAVVTTPVTPVTRTLSPVQGCQTLLANGTGDCTVVKTANGDLVVTVEPGKRIDDVLAVPSVDRERVPTVRHGARRLGARARVRSPR